MEGVVVVVAAAAATIGKDGIVRWSFTRGQVGEEKKEEDWETLLVVTLFPDSVDGVPGEEVRVLLSSEDGDCVERTEEDDDEEEVVVEVEEEEAEEDEPW